MSKVLQAVDTIHQVGIYCLRYSCIWNYEEVAGRHTAPS